MSLAERIRDVGVLDPHKRELTQALARFPKTLQEYREQQAPFNFVSEVFDAAELVTEAVEAYWAEKRLAWDAQKLDFYTEEQPLVPRPHVIIMPGLGGWGNVLDKLPNALASKLPPWVPWVRGCYDSTKKTLIKGGCTVSIVFSEKGFNDGDFDQMVELTAQEVERADGLTDRPKVLLGHSMGAMAQTLLGARHPDLIGKVDCFYQVGGPLPLRVNSLVRRIFNMKNRDGGFSHAQESIEFLSSKGSDEMNRKTVTWIAEQDHIVTGITPTVPRTVTSCHSSLLYNEDILDSVMVAA